MNFIAGAAEALRSTGHDHARQPQPGDQPFVEAEDQRTPSMEQTGTRPQAADFAPQYEGAAPVMPQPPVQPVVPYAERYSESVRQLLDGTVIATVSFRTGRTLEDAEPAGSNPTETTTEGTR